MPLNLGQIPKTKPWQFADLAELLLFAGYYSQISRSDLHRIIQEGLPDYDEPEFDGEDLDTAEINARDQKYVEDCFDQFEYRQKVFGELYPFSSDRDLLNLKKRLTKQSKLYLFLLCCSQFGRFTSQSLVIKSASSFTNVSAQALQNILSPKATIWIFDANSEHRATYFGNKLPDALKKLGREVFKETVNDAVCDQQDTSGDAGIDLIGIFPIDDGAKGMLSVVAQCAARQDDWIKKTLEAHPERLKSFFSFHHNPANFVFIPLLYRQTNGAWVNDVHTSGCIVIDRLRLMKALDSPLPVKLFREVQDRLSKLRDIATS